MPPSPPLNLHPLGGCGRAPRWGVGAPPSPEDTPTNTPDDRSDTRSIFITASPAQIFDALSDPERLARWWGPDGFRNTFHRFDFWPGGAWSFTMHGPDGQEYANESRFTTVVPGERVEIEHLTGHHFLLVIALTPEADGTRVHWRQTFDAAEHYTPIAAFLAEANTQNLRRLAAEVTRRTDGP